jgi:hypothetical protein
VLNDNAITGLAPPNSLDVLNFCNKVKKHINCDNFHSFGSAMLGGFGQLRRSGMDGFYE